MVSLENITDFEIPESTATDVPVVKWQNIACKLYVAGESFHAIANTLNVDEGEIKKFVTSTAGQVISRDLLDNEELAITRILRGAKFDTVNKLIQLRDNSIGNVCLSACKQILELADKQQDEDNMSPEQAKIEMEKLKKELSQ